MKNDAIGDRFRRWFVCNLDRWFIFFLLGHNLLLIDIECTGNRRLPSILVMANAAFGIAQSGCIPAIQVWIPVGLGACPQYGIGSGKTAIVCLLQPLHIPGCTQGGQGGLIGQVDRVQLLFQRQIHPVGIGFLPNHISLPLQPLELLFISFFG